MIAVLLALSLATQDTTAPDPAVIRQRAEDRARARSERAVRNAAESDSIMNARREAGLRAMADAYADSNTGGVVQRARAARQRNERLVTFYSANVRQRIGVGLRALRRDRTVFGQELSARIEWHRDAPSIIEVTGARQRIPVALRGDQVPEDLDNNVEWMVFDPAADYLRIVGDDAEGFQYPLREGAEADYTYALGDTTTIRLPTGRSVSVLELRVRPRRADFRLMSGALWFDADSYALVRAAFAPARAFDLELDGDSGDADDVPGVLKPIRGEVKYVTLEYGLYEQRWWMPRYMAIDLEAQASFIRMPVRFEREYQNYQVRGGAEPVAGARRPAGAVRPRERTDSATITMDPDSVGRAIAECVEREIREEAEADRREGRTRVVVGVGSNRYRRFERRCWQQFDAEEEWPVEVVIPDDTASLLSNPDLGEPILNMGDVISEDELRQFSREIGLIPQQPWQYVPRLPRGLGALLEKARYNRIEALSLGLGGQLDFGRLRVDGTARLGIADLEPNVELGLTRPTSNAAFRLGLYRRLAAANPETRPLGIGNSLSALFLQRDDGEYFRSIGAEITAENANAGWWRARLYAEHQKPAIVETNASLPRLFNRDNTFRSNIMAVTSDQVGGALTLRGSKVLSRALLAGADLTIDGTVGTRDYARAALTVRTTVSPGGPLAFAIEGATGASTTGDTVPPQGRFFLGGPATMRGFPGGTLSSDRFWRGRFEVANSFPAFRVVAFGDAGYAGRRIYSAGLGFSVLDGLIRLDLARGLEPYRNWRFDAYIDGLF